MNRGGQPSRVSPATAAIAVLSTVVAGCSTPPWESASTASPTASVSARPTASTPAPSPVHNDLAKGSLKRKLSAGGVTFVVNYWSTLDLRAWTPTVDKPINLSASGSFADGSSQDIFLTAVSLAVAVNGPAGPLPPPATQVDQASVQPGYLVTKPNSYGGVFTVPPVESTATSVTLTFTYQLLQQSAPKSKTFSKQTAVDTLTVPLAS